MLERDYILMVLTEFVRAVTEALRLAHFDRSEESFVQVEAAVSELVGLDPKTALSLSPDSLVQVMVLSGVGASVAGHAAYALDRLADEYEDAGNDELADTRRLQAEAIAESFGWDLNQVPEELIDLDDELYG